MKTHYCIIPIADLDGDLIWCEVWYKVNNGAVIIDRVTEKSTGIDITCTRAIWQQDAVIKAACYDKYTKGIYASNEILSCI